MKDEGSSSKTSGMMAFTGSALPEPGVSKSGSCKSRMRLRTVLLHPSSFILSRSALFFFGICDKLSLGFPQIAARGGAFAVVVIVSNRLCQVPGSGKGSFRLMSMSPSRIAELEPARVCIIKPSSLGDVVHCLPILAALRRRWPACHLSWVVNQPFQDLLHGHPHLDEVIVYDRSARGIDTLGIGGTAALFGRLLRGDFDLTIDLQGLFRSALMTAATRARVRVGMADAREGSRWFYTDLVEAPRLGLHAVERVGGVALAFGAGNLEPRFNLPISDQDRQWARAALARVPRPRIVLNLGADGPRNAGPLGTMPRSDGARSASWEPA